MILENQIIYDYLPQFSTKLPSLEPPLSDELFSSRLKAVTARMKKNNCDYLFFYADREHYMNFEYMLGFGPRFEEGILLLSKDEEAIIYLGNECFPMYKTSRIPAEGVLYQVLSLPSQDVSGIDVLYNDLRERGVDESSKVGIVGWKLMYPDYAESNVFDIPSYMIDILRRLVPSENLFNATDWFIHPDYGFRVINTAEEIANFEFGATYASESVRRILLNMHSGMTEIEISQASVCGFMSPSCHPKVLLGDRNDLGMVSPTTNKAKIGDRCQITSGLKGGLTSRKGFFAYSADDLPEGAKDYLDKIAIPYFLAAANWYEMIGIGVTGGEIYNLVDTVLPKAIYKWALNPGHLISSEEWISSPIRYNSKIVLRSGMCFQMDIIPQAPKPYAAVNCEDGIAIADKKLREEIQYNYPDTYQRMMERREFIQQYIGIHLKEEILPMSNMSGIFRPYMLNHDMALKVLRNNC